MKRYHCLFLLMCCTATLWAQQFSKPHGIYSQLTTLAITPSDGQAEIRYTLDGSEPTMASPLYEKPLILNKTTVVRAAEVRGDSICRPVATSTYVFPQSVLSQPNDPEGYPDHWGRYAQLRGTAPADYEMDPELIADDTYWEQIRKGIYELPILSLVTDIDNFFGLENDPVRGGIYIFTGSPVGNGDGRDWERPVSMELFGSPQQHDLTIDCAVKMHGGHGRLPEKNPKHSLRITFKSGYGPTKLDYPLFGERGVTTFNSLILRTFFGNAWQHWKDDSRTRAQYTRDLWARHMQRQLGHPYADGIYVHLFINGLYWGLYNIAERIDDNYCKEHFGGKKSDYDVVKVEEVGGSHYVDAADGSLDKWNEMFDFAERAANDLTSYYRLQGLNAQGERDESLEVLLDIDSFIDYMLINQYGGNTDWDAHNWYAFRNRTRGDSGFQFICWDTESIFESLSDNKIDLNNKQCPSRIFHQLMKNRMFQNRYMDRAYKLLSPGGLLSEEKVVALWDSLYHTIASSLYAESARWGDYRRDVHPYSSRGELYTIDNHFMTERHRLLTQYFPYRSEEVLSQLEQKGWYSTSIEYADNRRNVENGRGKIFDLQGREVQHPARRGIYIRNRKLIIH